MSQNSMATSRLFSAIQWIWLYRPVLIALVSQHLEAVKKLTQRGLPAKQQAYLNACRMECGEPKGTRLLS